MKEVAEENHVFINMGCFGNGGNYWRNASVFNAENLASATVQNSNDDLLLNY